MKLVDTPLAVEWILHWGPPWIVRTEGREQVQKRIYKWQAEGLLINHGKTGKGQARWDMDELKKLVYGS